MLPKYDEIICLGDFNIDKLRTKSSATIKLNKTLESLGLVQLMVSQPASQPLGDLALLDCADEDDNAVLHRIKRLATAHLPEGWPRFSQRSVLLCPQWVFCRLFTNRQRPFLKRNIETSSLGGLFV
nr:unnamed protein product [Callosobruchus chinensis]